MNNASLPSLTIGFPAEEWVNPINLAPLAYRGGAAIHLNARKHLTGDWGLGLPELDRVPVLMAIHEYLEGKRVEGAARSSIVKSVKDLRSFYTYLDEADEHLTVVNARSLFAQWLTSLNERARRGEIAEQTVDGLGKAVAKVLASALTIIDGVYVSPALLRHSTRVRNPGKAPGSSSDTSNLGIVRSFIGDLRDVIDALDITRLYSQLPLTISFRSTGATFQHWSGMEPDDAVKAITHPAAVDPYNVRNTLRQRLAASQDMSLSRRLPLLNLRISAEFCLFVAATGINPSQASALTLGDYRFQSFEGRYKVKKYKGRLGGEVEFSIIKAYRPIFERYLAFRREAFQDTYSDRLFIRLNRHGEHRASRYSLNPIRAFFSKIDRPFVPPKVLRKAKANVWKRLTGNDRLTAEVLQHSPDTLRRHYLVPNHHAAVKELSAYFATVVPGNAATESTVAPGHCIDNRRPEKALFATDEAPTPDCASAGGCLFCVHYRGIESQDYIWMLLSYQYLKRVEVASYKLLKEGTGDLALMAAERISDIVAAFEAKGPNHARWTMDARERLKDEDYHPRWQGFIELAELL